MKLKSKNEKLKMGTMGWIERRARRLTLGGVVWARRGKAPSPRHLPRLPKSGSMSGAQSMTSWALSKRGFDSARVAGNRSLKYT